MKMFRLLRGEMHKILMRPILYIITGILVLALFLSISLVGSNMSNRDTYYSFDGDTKDEVYQKFMSGTIKKKSDADKLVEDALSLINNYKLVNEASKEDSTEKTTSTQLKDYATEAFNLFNNYYYLTQQTRETETNLSELTNKKAELNNTVTSFNTLLSDSVKTNIPLILITKTDFDISVNLLTNLSSILQAKINENKLADHKLIISKLSQPVGFKELDGVNFFDKLKTFAYEKIDDFIVDESVLKELTNTHTKIYTHLQSLYASITSGLNDDDVLLEDFRQYANGYLHMSQTLYNYVTDKIYIDPVKNYTDSKLNTYTIYQLNDRPVNSYEVKQRIVRNGYLLDNNLNANDFANVFSATASFSKEISAFDLVYFGLEICGFVILIFCVILAAGMIAGEQNSGTLKVLAIRPYSRGKILTSKLLATLIFGLIFIIFSALVLFIIGYFQYGIDMTNILVVFNASQAFVISPIVLLLIYMGLLLFKILFYIILATMISVVFRSNIWAVAISILIYFASALFSVLFASSYWYAFTPFACIDLFKFFGGNFAGASNQISIALSSPIFYNSNFVVSVVVSIFIMLLFTIISYTTFKKREIK